MPSEGLELGAVGEHGFQAEPVVLLEGVGVGEQPAVDRPDRAWPDVREPWCRPQGTQVVADGAVATAVAVLGDLLPQLPGVGAAVLPPLVEVWLECIDLGRPILPLATEQLLRNV